MIAIWRPTSLKSACCPLTGLEKPIRAVASVALRNQSLNIIILRLEKVISCNGATDMALVDSEKPTSHKASLFLLHFLLKLAEQLFQFL
jgi:hypothetical protein